MSKKNDNDIMEQMNKMVAAMQEQTNLQFATLLSKIETMEKRNQKLEEQFVQVKTETNSAKKKAPSASVRAATKNPYPPLTPKPTTTSKKLAFSKNDSDSDSDESNTPGDAYETKAAIKSAADAIPKLGAQDSLQTGLNFIKRFESYLHANGLGKHIQKLGKLPSNTNDDNYKDRSEQYAHEKAQFEKNDEFKSKLRLARTLFDAKLKDDLNWLTKNLKKTDFMGAWEALHLHTNKTGSEQQAEELLDKFNSLEFGSMSFLDLRQ